VIDLSNAQEVTKQQEAMAKTAEMQAATAQHQLAAERERGEQNRKTDQARAQQHAQMKQYEDELARKRYASEHEQTRQRNAEMVRMQEEASARQESLRRQTEESIQQSRRETDRQKAENERELIRAKSIAEAEGRIAENRANEDVIRRQMLARVEAETTKAMALLKETVSAFGAGFNGLLADKQRGTALVAGLTALAAGVYGAREGSRMGFRMLERYLGQPSLVRETSRNIYGFRPKAAAAAAPAPAPAAAGAPPGAAGSPAPKSNILGDVVLEKSLETRVSQLAIATANTRKNAAPFRNVMLYGPPGTGKTMAAKRLARYSGLDYALMTGGDVAPLGADAVTRIHELFDWASTSRRGLLLFIDEADAFLAKRGGAVAEKEGAPGVRAALNALLYRTGELSRDVVLVIATNRPEDLDTAVLDRMDEAMEFALPDEEARARMARLYFDKLIVRGEDAGDDAPAQGLLGAIGLGKGGRRGGGKTGTPIVVDPAVDDAAMREVAKRTEGFSGREIAKMMASVQGAVYGSAVAELSRETLFAVVAQKVAEHASRKTGFK
jgi:ATPase family AAA domain-containing protein 3A/B